MDNHELFVVNPERLHFAFLGRPLQWRRDQLSERVRASGGLWATIRMRSTDLLPILNELGDALGKEQELADFAFENSPFDTLPLNSTSDYDPLFGYFPPEMVREYNRLFKALPEDFMEALTKRGDDGRADRVLYALKSSFAEAETRSFALAVNHC